jgi:SAM-dependent methyltransferase
VISKLFSVLRRFRERGLRAGARYILSRSSERYHEWRLGIDTGRCISRGELGLDDPDCADYHPTMYRHFKSVMRDVAIRNGQDVFLDYGCGMGRVVVLAATYPFRRVIGVELSRQLVALAEENVRRARKKLRCPDVIIEHADALTFVVPADVTVIHLFNPFFGKILARVLDNIEQSLVDNPRRLTILVSNCIPRFDPLACQRPGSLVKRREYTFDPHFKYAIYDWKGEARVT